jgi:putative FmdB family regulatory protein
MAVYNYKCLVCETEFEVSKKMLDMDKPEECPKCGQTTERLFPNLGAVIFKGTGFYKTDNKKVESNERL